MKATPEFYAALEAFRAAAEVKASARATVPLTLEEGPKKVRVVKNCSGKAVFCFVDKATGDILKAESWSSAAKGKRGSIYDDDHGASAVTEYGANYCRW